MLKYILTAPLEQKVIAVKLSLIKLIPVGIALMGCTPAQLAAWDTAIKSGAAAVVPAENLACAIATAAGDTAVCAQIDATGAVIGQAFTVIEDAPSIAALLSKAPMKPAAQAIVAAKIATLKAPEKK